MKLRVEVVLGLMCMLLPAVTLMAQEAKGPGEFYEGDFARSPLESAAVVDKQQADDAGAAGGEQGPNAKSLSKQDQGLLDKFKSVKGVVPERPSKAGDTVASQVLPEGIKVLSIGAVLNAVDENHFVDSATELLELSRQYEIPIGELFLLGDVRSIMNHELIPKLLGRGADLSLRLKVPEQYQVNRSPTWIIATEKGQFVLEGVSALTRYITARGEFIEQGSANIFSDQELIEEPAQGDGIVDMFAPSEIPAGLPAEDAAEPGASE